MKIQNNAFNNYKKKIHIFAHPFWFFDNMVPPFVQVTVELAVRVPNWH